MSDNLIQVRVSLFFTRKELLALQELGRHLSPEQQTIAGGVSGRINEDIAVNFLVRAYLWDTRQALDLPGEDA